MTNLPSPQFRCLAGVARRDITPPVGIYHRMWGAALHDQATGVHRPLTATVLRLQPLAETGLSSTAAQLIISLDHCILESAEMQALAAAAATAAELDPAQVLITLTHTHGSGWMARSRSHLPGGQLIESYLLQLREEVAAAAAEASRGVRPAIAVLGSGRCSLARQRDFFDPVRGHAVCGLNPDGHADETVLVASITDDSQQTLAVIVNYACHPTTLAWDNTLISPDYVGALRETVEQVSGGLCLFLQGASGDLGPREGFTGDTAVADRNGRELGYAVLAALQALPHPGAQYTYRGPVLSGTWIGEWKHEPLPAAALAGHAEWNWHQLILEVPYRHDLPTIEETIASRARWLAEEQRVRQLGAANHQEELRVIRANTEQLTRQLTRLEALAPGRCCPLKITLGISGDAIWVFTPGELYQVFQQTLRQRFAPRPVFITTLTGDWQPGYIPPAASYGYGIYQEVIAATAPGSLEVLIEEITRALKRCL
ncbi:MAG: hypothetical protein RL215_220 [Planctomycetota bacterium]